MKKALFLILLIAPAAAHDLGVGFDAAAEAGLFPTFNEVASALDAAAVDSRVTLFGVGSSGSGEPIRVAEIIIGDKPLEGRAVTFIMTQQHGNEPAGTPAAVDLLSRIVDGEFATELENQVLLLLPMANPDGSGANTRGNQDGTDINRDHIGLETDEARAIHAVLNQWDVHVAVDHHEYSGTGVGYPSPVRFYDYDVTTMFPNHGNVDPGIRAMAESLIYDGVWPHMEAKGYSAGNYGVQTVAGVPVQQVAGGPDPGILRNAFGLNNVVGFLAESFVGVEQNPLHDAVRREAIHFETMSATISFVHENSAAITAAKKSAGAINEQNYMESYLEDPIVGALPQAFQGGNIDALMALHGLPLGTDIAGQTTYNMLNARQGLLAAMLSPDSTRSVGDYAGTAPVAVAADADAPEAKATPAVLGLGLLFVFALFYRRN
jgi:hypothetical protein